MGRLMPLIGTRLTAGTVVADRILNWEGDPAPSGDSVPLRLAGALHALKLTGLALNNVYPPVAASDDDLWGAVSAAMETHADHILAWLKNPPQTNEVRRAAAILPALVMINNRYDRPVELLELGASAGLNLRADQFCLVLPSRTLGDDASEVRIEPDWTGPLPDGDLPQVIARKGVDLAPFDPLSDAGRLRLLAYLWPDQPDRIERTAAAIRIAEHVPAEVSAGDAAAWIETVLATPARDRVRVVFHTVAWQYFPEETKARAKAAMGKCPSPLVQISMEADGGQGAALSVTHYPSREVEALGRVDFHGRWVRWQSSFQRSQTCSPSSDPVTGPPRR